MTESATNLKTHAGSAWHVNSDQIMKDLGFVSGAGSPVGVLTPDYVGQAYFDSTNLQWFQSVALTSADWQIDSSGGTAAAVVGFYGTTPIAQRSGSNEALVTTTPATTSAFGFGQAQANGIVTLLNEIRNTLVALGLFKGSA